MVTRQLRSFIVLLDEMDSEFFDSQRWHPLIRRGAQGRLWVYAQNNDNKLLHRFIMGAAPGQYVDHVNGSGLDNRRSNLRFCNVAQNRHNSKPCLGREYKGVSWYKNYQKWSVQIVVNGRKHHGGYFFNAIDAARKYDSMAREFHGEFAWLNFPKDNQ